MKKRWLILLALLLPLVWLLWPAAPPEIQDQTPADRVQEYSSLLRMGTKGVGAKRLFAELKAALLQMDRKAAREWLLTQLASGNDFAAQLDLALDSRQNLSGWSTWRVFLLDLLFLTDPGAAEAVSRELLGTSSSPDEWAVCLRNLARGRKDDELLKVKSAELLRREEWKKNPSAGYLEAFDVIVHIRHTALAPDLLANCDAIDKKAVRHASYLTLDRLILAAPEKVLPDLAKIASEHPQSGLMLSNMMARADVRDLAQRQALETYLLDPKRTAEELRGFASVFPNINIAISSNLLTKAPTMPGVDLADRDRASLEFVAGTLTDARLAHAHDALRTSLQRLIAFTKRPE